MAEAGEKIDIGGPGADAMQRGQRGVGVVGGKVREAFEDKPLARDRTGDRFEGTDLGGGKAEPRQPRRSRAQQARGVERIECRGKPAPDRGGARGRELLRHDDGRKPRKPARPAP